MKEIRKRPLLCLGHRLGVRSSRVKHITCRGTLCDMLETIKVQLWGKDIKEREGEQNNKQEMQKTGEAKNEEECKERGGRLRKIIERK